MTPDQKATPAIGEFWIVKSRWGEITARRHDGGSGWLSCEHDKDIYQDNPNSIEPIRIAPNPREATVGAKELDPVVCALIEGLTAPPQYKQHYLEKALRALVMDEWVNTAQKEFEWQTGAKP